MCFPGIHTVEGIAVDWMADNLYWTDDGPKKTISAARLEKASQTRKTLIEGKMTHPRAIVVDRSSTWVNGKRKSYCLELFDGCAWLYSEDICHSVGRQYTKRSGL